MKVSFGLLTFVVTLLSCILSTGAIAQTLNGSDLVLTGSTPSIIYDDTDQVGLEWDIQGRNGFFAIRDLQSNQNFFGITRSRFSIALGYGSSTANPNTIAVGNDASASQEEAVALGFDARATGVKSTALGGLASSPGEFSTALGYGAFSFARDSTALGVLALSDGLASTALGSESSAVGGGSTALGNSANAAGADSTALGRSASSAGRSSTALGHSASSAGSFSIALGQFASSAGNESIALGRLASSAGSGSTALGFLADSVGSSSIALGYAATSGGNRSTALGYFASAPNPDTIVLGAIPGINDPFGSNQYVSVANGTTAPLAPLHIFRDDGTAQVLVEETSMDAVPRTLFRLASAGSNAKFEIDNTLAGVNWAFTNAGTDFRISRQGSGVVEFRVFNNGDAFIAGDLEVGGDLFTNVLLPSDKKLKQNVETIDPETVLEKVAALPLSAWEYKDRPGERHIGPMAQDFRAAFGLGRDEKSISTVDASGVALASIKALAKQNDLLEARNRKLQDEIETLRDEFEQVKSLKREIADLRAVVGQLLPQITQN